VSARSSRPPMAPRKTARRSVVWSNSATTTTFGMGRASRAVTPSWLASVTGAPPCESSARMLIARGLPVASVTEAHNRQSSYVSG
jgi:hypothetical protein